MSFWDDVLHSVFNTNPGGVITPTPNPLGDAIIGHPAEKKLLGSFLATSYGPPWDAMNGTGVTSQGTDLRGNKGVGKYIIAVDPGQIPYGTHVNIEPNPFGDPNISFLADDTGGAINGKHIDIFDWRGRQHQLAWGARQVKVYEAVGGSGIAGSGPVEAVTGAVGDTADFLGDAVSTLLNFRKMGELLAKISAWFLRLIARAIWDYVIAPVLHWNERAVSYYWSRFFGPNPGDGFMLQNSATITLSFWALGYGMLWSSVDPKVRAIAPPRETLLGRTVRSVEGQYARRHLVKPSQVKEKTPAKPEPKESKVEIVRTREFSAQRRRPVNIESRRGQHGSGPRRPIQQHQQPRPQRQTPEQPQSKIIIPEGIVSGRRSQAQTTKPRRSGVGSPGTSGSHPEVRGDKSKA